MQRALRVISLTLVVGCAAHEPRVEATPGSPTPKSEAAQATPADAAPASAETAAVGPAQPSELVPTTPLSASPAPATPPPASSATLPAVETEVPYRLGARPLPAEAVNASAHDTVLGAWNQGGNSDPAQPWNRPGFHPATRVILDTKLLSGKKSLGKLTPGAILAQTRAQGYWPFRLCFEEALRKGGKGSGSAVLRFSIDTRGHVSFARKMKAEGSAELANCWRKAAYAPKYRPAPARRVDVELTAQLARGDVLLPPRDPPPDRAVARARLVPAPEERAPRVAECYAAGLARDPKLWGRIELVLSLDAKGVATEVRELGSRFPDAEVTECVRALFSGSVYETERSNEWVIGFKLGSYTPP